MCRWLHFRFSVAWVVRLTFTLLFLVPAFICLGNDKTTETCGNVSLFRQNLRNNINTAGTLVEAGSSFLIILLIFCWRKFSVTNLFLALPRLAVFWFWIGLFSLQTFSTINRDILQLNPDKWYFLGVSLTLEYATLVLLSLALKFTDKSTVTEWIKRRVANQSAIYFSYLCALYILTLWMYMLRNLAVGSYHMALFTKRINLHAKMQHMEKLLNLAAIAFRISFVQFSYAAIFRNPNLPKVCKEQTQSRDEIFPIAIEGPEERVQALIPWNPYIE